MVGDNGRMLPEPVNRFAAQSAGLVSVFGRGCGRGFMRLLQRQSSVINALVLKY
jgi:hypothetical protein